MNERQPLSKSLQEARSIYRGPTRFARPDERLPKLGIIITHYNYSHLVEGTIRSVLDQSHSDVDCIIVDDCSSAEHFARLEAIASEIEDPRLKLVRMPRNSGQVHSFFRGLEETDAEFVSMLDPDDLLSYTFAEKMIAAHLNPHVIAPVACCDQGFFRNNGDVLSGTNRRDRFHKEHANLSPEEMKAALPLNENYDNELISLYYLHPKVKGWLWFSTSSIVYRRDAVELLRPRRPLAYSGRGDTYLANVSHMMGGTLWLNCKLVYRGKHEGVEFQPPRLISFFQSYQGKHYKSPLDESSLCIRDAIEAFFENDGMDYFDTGMIIKIIVHHLTLKDIVSLSEAVPQFRAIVTGRAE